MPQNASGSSRSVLWTGKPRILPSALARSILVIIIAIVASWLEFYFSIAYEKILNVELILWTGLVFFLFWAFSLTHLILLRASNTYILRNDSLEIRSGILTSRSFVVAPPGFSDMEVIRSVTAKIMDLGDIIIHTQGGRGSPRKMRKIRNPLEVADQIREVLSIPIVRME